MSENPAGLNQAAMQALGAGDFATAQALLQRLVAADPSSVPGWLNLAAVRRRLNDANGAFARPARGPAARAQNFPALLMSATLLEREGDMKAAAGAYGAALANAPPDNYLDRPTQQAVAHGREIHAATPASCRISSAPASAIRKASARPRSGGASNPSST
jgi:tetratricopeptide (TPR) repeat protein